MKRFTFHLFVAAGLAIAPAAALAQQPSPSGSSYDNPRSPTPNKPMTDTPGARQDSQSVHGRPHESPTPVPGTTPAPSPTTTGSQGTTGTQTPPGPGTPGMPPTTGTPPSAPNPPGTTPTGAMAGNLSASDLEVVQKLHRAHQQELDVAKMAVEKAQSPKVKAYAKKLVADHTTFHKQVMAFAERNKVERSQVEMASTPAAAKEAPAARLEASAGAEFDREFVNMMVAEHEKAVDMVKSAKDTVTDKKLKAMLTSQLPKLERHKKMAQDLADKQTKT